MACRFKAKLRAGMIGMLMTCAAFAARADEATERMINAVQALGHKIPIPSVLAPACDDDALCVARFIKDQIGAGAILVPAVDADAGTAAPKRHVWRRATPALTAVETLPDGALYLRLTRFDTRAVVDAVAAIVPAPAHIILDLAIFHPGCDWIPCAAWPRP